MNLFAWLTLAIKAVEALYPLAGSGKSKKETVKTGAKVLVDIMGKVSTGGQKDTWERLEPDLDALIDHTANMLFPKEAASTNNIEDMRPSD